MTTGRDIIGAFATVGLALVVAFAGLRLFIDADGAPKAEAIRTEKSIEIRETQKAFAQRTGRLEAKYGFPSDGGVPRPGYTTRINQRTRQPDWVIWRVDMRGSVDRKGFTWKSDPNVPPDHRQHAKWYEGAHWHADGVRHGTRDARLELGHMKPADNSKQSVEDMAACMVLEDNICPQTSALNEKVWRYLEAFVGKLAETPNAAVVCCCGPLWYADGGDVFEVQVLGDDTGQIPIPSHFFKTVLIDRGGEYELRAWVLPNMPSPPADFDAAAVTVDRVEQLTAFDFWSALPDTVEDALETKLP